MRIPFLSLTGFFLTLGGFAVASCGQKPITFDTDAGGGGDDSGNVDEQPLFQVDGSDDSGDCVECSSDLHNIVKCGTNTVVQTCTGKTACGGGSCVDACDAAAANKSSIGCDYYAIPSDAWSTTFNSGGAAGNCFAAFVNNNWSADMNV